MNNGHAHCSEAHRQWVFDIYYDLVLSALAAHEEELLSRIESARTPMPSPN